MNLSATPSANTKPEQAACGGGGDEEPSAASQQSKDDATASKSIADSILASQKSGSGQVFTVSTKDANCIGDGLVEKLGTEKLQKYKLRAEYWEGKQRQVN